MAILMIVVETTNTEEILTEDSVMIPIVEVEDITGDVEIGQFGLLLSAMVKW